MVIIEDLLERKVAAPKNEVNDSSLADYKPQS
jgi:hypothetical protein